jgi:TadE-like protein
MGAHKENEHRCRADSPMRRMLGALRSACRSERGTALVEFALVLPVLSILLFGMLDLGKAFNYWIDETHLASEGARWAAVDKNPGASAGQTLQQYIQSQADTRELRGAARVSICFPQGTSKFGDPVKVIVTDDYSFLGVLTHKLRFLSGRVVRSPSGSTKIVGSAVMRLEAPPSSYVADPGISQTECNGQ